MLSDDCDGYQGHSFVSVLYRAYLYLGYTCSSHPKDPLLHLFALAHGVMEYHHSYLHLPQRKIELTTPCIQDEQYPNNALILMIWVP